VQSRADLEPLQELLGARPHVLLNPRLAGREQFVEGLRPSPRRLHARTARSALGGLAAVQEAIDGADSILGDEVGQYDARRP
jgi:hypothetical protein